MELPEFPIEKTDSAAADITPKAETLRPIRRYVESPMPGPTSTQGYDSLLDYWHILVRHRMTLLTFVCVGVLAALLISLVQTPIYRVRTSLEIQGDNFLDLKGPDSGTTSASDAAVQSYLETQVKLLQSESLIEDVIDKMKLHKDKATTAWGIFASAVHHLFFFSSTARLPEREQLIRQVERNLTVQSSGNSRLLEVLYESPDPKVASDFANTLVSEFIELTQEERWKAAQGTAEWLTNHLDQMKQQLEASEAQLQDYARTSGLSYYTSDKESLAENRLKELQDELSKAQADRIAAQAKFDEARKKSADSLPEVLDDPTMREDRQKLTDLQRQYAELSTALTPAHPRVQRVQAQIDELQSQLKKERANVLGRMSNEYSAAALREKLLTEAHANQQQLVADQSSKAIHYDTLKRDVDSNQHLYETMLQRVKEASLAAAMRDSNVMVIDRARPPLLPYRPSLSMNSAIGLLSSMFLGFAFVLLRERLNRRISAPGEAQVYLELPELGVIPLDEAAALPWRDTKRFHLPARTALPNTAAVRANGGPELATWKRKPSLIAECARTTLTSILLPNQDGELPQVVVLTSPSPGDGKTTVACNLSAAVAEIGRKVLLVDGDLRRPRLHKVFGVPNTWGLSDLLWRDTPLEAAPIAQLVRPTEVSWLCLLSAGSCAVPPTNLFYSPRMSRLMTRLRREFDMILIDAPPMIHLADARVLGRLADGVILVVRAGQTTTESARCAVQRFAEDGTRVLGTVLNSWDPRTTGTYGYGSYAYAADAKSARS